MEGEKDVERLRERGLVATTPIEGAGSGLRSEYCEQLQGADIVLLYDEDKAGHQRRDQWLKLLNGIVNRIRVVKLPGLEYQEKGGEDVSDWLRKGHTVDELLKLVEETDPHFGELEKGLVALNLQEFLSKKIPEREMILAPIIPKQGLAMLYSKRGVGKTFLSLAIGYAVATGISLLRWECMKSVPVLYVDGEMPASMMQERLKGLVDGKWVEMQEPSNFRIVTPDLQEGGIPDISTIEGQQLIESVIGDAKLVILDNLSTLAPRLQENESDAWAPIQGWSLQLRRRGISLLMVHHAGKSGNQRGTSRREDILDTVINLKHAVGYSASEGATFEIHIEKARGFFGDDADPFVAKLVSSQSGALEWSESDYKEDDYDEIVEEIRAGNSYRRIAEKLNITRSKVEATVRKARIRGDLTEDNNALGT
ncbi:MAG: AAA family ATPase [Chlamydiia bacterium]|nr:AAA family ATPase [Chlamydiia bacterium]